MLGTLRKHSQWMWVIIIIVIIISFVIWPTPDAQLGGRDEGKFGTIYGRPIETAEINSAAREAQLGFFFRYRTWPDRPEIARMAGFDLDSEARQRLVLSEALKRSLVIVSDSAVAHYIRQNFPDRNQPGKYDPQAYASFLRETLAPRGISEADFHNFIRHQIGVGHLVALRGMSGSLVTSRAAEATFRLENESVLTEAVFLQDTNFVASVVIETNALSQFFTNRMATYRIPERVQVGYVAFASSNYFAEADKTLAAVTNLTALIDAEFTARGTNALRGPEGTTLTPDDAKKKLRDELRKDHARTNAMGAATAFANELYRIKDVGPTNLYALAAQKKMPVLDSGPFDDIEGPVGQNLSIRFIRTAFSLTAEAPLSPTVEGPDGYYILALKRRISSENAAFDAVKDRVIADYKRAQSHELCMQAARAAMTKLTNGLAQGKSFKDTAETEKITVVEVPALNRRLRQMAPLDERGADLQRYREEAFRLGKGRVSQPEPTFGGGGAYFFYVKEVTGVTEEKLKTDLPGYTDEYRERRMGGVFSEWFNREFERSGILGARQNANPGKGQPPAE